MKVNGIELDIIDSTGVYGYEWSEFAVMRGDDGYLYVGSASGCSCNDFTDSLSAIEQVQSWQEAATKAKEWSDHAYSDTERKGCMDMIERLTDERPAAFDPSNVVLRGES